MKRKISQVGIRLIKNFEGCRLTAYKPVATEKYWTIGWGHYGKDVTQGMTITQAQADAMLAADLPKYEAYVNSTTFVPVTAQLNQNQYDALVSFCYNLGQGNLKKLCKDRTIAQIGASIPLYNKAGGNVLTGLIRRRKAEQELFNQSAKGAELVSDKVTVIVNDKKVDDGRLIDGITLVPLRAIGEALGAEVRWDNKTKTASLTKK